MFFIHRCLHRYIGCRIRKQNGNRLALHCDNCRKNNCILIVQGYIYRIACRNRILLCEDSSKFTIWIRITDTLSSHIRKASCIVHIRLRLLRLDIQHAICTTCILHLHFIQIYMLLYVKCIRACLVTSGNLLVRIAGLCSRSVLLLLRVICSLLQRPLCTIIILDYPCLFRELLSIRCRKLLDYSDCLRRFRILLCCRICSVLDSVPV